MKVALSTIGKFHTFDLARELFSRNALAGIYTGYPQFKLREEGLPHEVIHTFPWIHAAYMAFPMKEQLPRAITQQWEHVNATTFGNWVARTLPDCDIYVGLSGSTLPAGKHARSRGIIYVCDRGSAHIRMQDELLREEHELWGLPYAGIDVRAIDREESEYCEADCITVPSRFVLNSFLSRGIPRKKLRLLPYGVNLSRFYPVSAPAPDRFDVLFVGGMSLQKGVQYLVQAFHQVCHAKKSLTFVGASSPKLISILKERGLWPQNVQVLGHIPQTELKNLMSSSHVMVLPSVQEGFGMVMAQAMACGCPVIASRNTGADDLFSDGSEGFIVPSRSVDALTSRMQQLADSPDERATMSRRAAAKVVGIGGWSEYGQMAVSVYSSLIQQ